MSPTVNNFVHDLVAMAQAMETLPQVQAELEQTKIERQSLLDRIDRINADLEQSRNYAASLEQKVRTTEAERDDAELRFLGLEEKTDKVLDMLVMVKAYASDAKEALSPPKPQPELEPVQTPVSEAVQSIEPDWKQDQAETSTMPQGQSVTDPSSGQSVTQSAIGAETGTTESVLQQPATPQPPASQDQSEVNPTNPVTEQATSASSNDAKTLDVGSIAEPKPSGPYADKRYFDVSGYVSHLDWLEGGGTEENYNWRPAY